MQKILIRYIGLPVLTLSSAFAFYYLNNVELPVAEKTTSVQFEKPKKERKSIVITDPITKKKQLIIIDPPKWIDTIVTDSPKVEDAVQTIESEKGMLPDVEFLKFVIQKSREGIPVLSIGNYLNFL